MRLSALSSILLIACVHSFACGGAIYVASRPLVGSHGVSPQPSAEPDASSLFPISTLLDHAWFLGMSDPDGAADGAVCEGDACINDEGQSAAPSSAGSLSPELIELREQVRSVLGAYHQRKLNSRDHNPWEVMHAIIGYGVDSDMRRGGPQGEVVNSIGWLCYNGACRGHRLLYVDRGRVAARKGPDVQGHYGQFLAILAQSRVKTDYPLLVDGKNFTIADLIESEKLGCQRGMELTFKLIALAHYLDLDATWKNQSGEEWSVEKLVREELAAPIRGAACGGTHRLMGLAYAVNKRQRLGQPMSGDFQRAKIFLDDYHRYTLSLQNADGSFSTEWFNRRGDRTDLNRRLQTTGHILEWMAYSLPQESLTDPKIIKAVDYLTGVLRDNEKRGWEIGPLGHGIHALAIYDARVFKPHDTADAGQTLARRATGAPNSAAAASVLDASSNDDSADRNSDAHPNARDDGDTTDPSDHQARPATEGPALFTP